MRRVVIAILLAAGCGDDGGGAAPIDAAGPDADVPPGCGRWTVEERPATAIEPFDPAPVHTDRTTRVVVTVPVAPCERIAMIDVGYTLEGTNAILTPRVWVPVGSDCSDPPVSVARPVALQLPSPGTWTVSVLADTPRSVAIEVGSPPDRACNPTLPSCEMDCDCPDGEKCLGFDGLGGVETACAVPCEVDRDCGGGTCEGWIADGLGFACTPTPPECGDGDPCPTGWTCDGGACQPDFVLAQGTRGECACDADCAPGLRCVVPYDPAAPARCQAICETGGPWCQGAHVCGALGQDLSGLAGTDSVCGWLGE